MYPHYKAGQPDYVGIAAGVPQLQIAEAARFLLGSGFGYSSTITLSSGFTFASGDPKCNAFVYFAAEAGGAVVPLDSGGSPPRANDWLDDPRFVIAGWTDPAHPSSWEPEPGVVVARPSKSWLFGVVFTSVVPRSGHCGIVDYNGSWISAGELGVNRGAHITDTTYYQPAAYRKN